MELLLAIMITIIVVFVYFMGGRWGHRMVWDIPKNGKPYQIIAVKKASHFNFSSGFPDKNHYVIVFNREDGLTRLVELPDDSGLDTNLVVGRWIFKTSAGYEIIKNDY